jgi:hypothetical protein
MAEPAAVAALAKALATPRALQTAVNNGLNSRTFDRDPDGKRSAPSRIRGVSSVFKVPALGYTAAKGTAKFEDMTYTGQLGFTFTPVGKDLPTITRVQPMPAHGDLGKYFSECAYSYSHGQYAVRPAAGADRGGYVHPLGAMSVVRRPRLEDNKLTAVWVGDEVPQRWLVWSDFMAADYVVLGERTTSWNFVGVFRVHNSPVWDPPQLLLAPAVFTDDGRQGTITAQQLRDVVEPTKDVAGDMWDDEENAEVWENLRRRTAPHKWVLAATTVSQGTTLLEVLQAWGDEKGGLERDGVQVHLRAMVLQVLHALETMRATCGAMHIGLFGDSIVGVQCQAATKEILCFHETHQRPGHASVVRLPVHGVLWRLTNFETVACDVLFGRNDRAAAMALWDVNDMSLAHLFDEAPIDEEILDQLSEAPVVLWDVVKLMLILGTHGADSIVRDMCKVLGSLQKDMSVDSPDDGDDDDDSVVDADTVHSDHMTLKTALAKCKKARTMLLQQVGYADMQARDMFAKKAGSEAMKPDPGAMKADPGAVKADPGAIKANPLTYTNFTRSEAAVEAILTEISEAIVSERNQQFFQDFYLSLAFKWKAAGRKEKETHQPVDKAHKKYQEESKKRCAAWVPLGLQNWIDRERPFVGFAYGCGLLAYAEDSPLSLWWRTRTWHAIERSVGQAAAQSAIVDYRKVWQRELRIAPLLVQELVPVAAGHADAAEHVAKLRTTVQELLQALPAVTTFTQLHTMGGQLAAIVALLHAALGAKASPAKLLQILKNGV